MAKNRKKVEEFILKYIEKITPGGKNRDLYKDLFKSMNDKEFHKFMEDLRDNKITLSVIVPNGSGIKVSVKNNYKIGKELGYEFFQRLRIEGEEDKPPYLTPNKYIVYKLPIRRAAQLLSKKISIPVDNRHVDLTTGQVTGVSKGSKISLPETQLLTGMGAKHSLVELLKFRGGDEGSLRVMNMALAKTGEVEEKLLMEYSEGVTSTKTLKYYWLASHIRSTL